MTYGYATTLKVVEQRAVAGYAKEAVDPLGDKLRGAGKHEYPADDKPDAADDGKPFGKSGDARQKDCGLRNNKRGEQERQREAGGEHRQKQRAPVSRRGAGCDKQDGPQYRPDARAPPEREQSSDKKRAVQMPEFEERRQLRAALARERRQAHKPEHGKAKKDKHDAAELRQNVAPRADKDAEQPSRRAEQYKNRGKTEHKRERVFKDYTPRAALGGGVGKRRDRNAGDKRQVPRHHRERAGRKEHHHTRKKSPDKERHVHVRIVTGQRKKARPRGRARACRLFLNKPETVFLTELYPDARFVFAEKFWRNQFRRPHFIFHQLGHLVWISAFSSAGFHHYFDWSRIDVRFMRRLLPNIDIGWC